MKNRENIAKHQKRQKHNNTTQDRQWPGYPHLRNNKEGTEGWAAEDLTDKEKTELCHQTQQNPDRNHMQFDLFTTEHINIERFRRVFSHLLRAINSSHFHKSVHEIFPESKQDPFSGRRKSLFKTLTKWPVYSTNVTPQITIHKLHCCTVQLYILHLCVWCYILMLLLCYTQQMAIYSSTVYSFVCCSNQHCKITVSL